MIFALHKLGNIMREEKRAAAKVPVATIDPQSAALSGKTQDTSIQKGASK
jgi:hypothetical protein